MSTSPLRVSDRATLGLGMSACAVLLGRAIDVRGGMYSPRALEWLTIAAVISLAAVALRMGTGVEKYLCRCFTAILGVIAFLSAFRMLYQNRNDDQLIYPILFFVGIGLLQIVNLRALRIPILAAMVLAFCAVSAYIFTQRITEPNIDVFLFQQSAAKALIHGHNPYEARFPNIYSGNHSAEFQNPRRFGPGTPFYGPGVVDDNGWLTYGFPYPPLSLLLVLPGYLLGGDSRFALVIAAGLAAFLMSTARPGHWGALAALLFLVNPVAFFVINMAWTEPLLLFTFSLAMYCACRWRKGLPWALGLFFATKQYTVLALPLLFLLTEGPNPFKELGKMVTKAGLVVAAIMLPFVAWNPRAFIRGVVQWQLVQSFRTDALSYLVWIYNHYGGLKAPLWTPFLFVIPVIGLALWRCPHTPAGFAAAVTLVCIVFFAFNKQAFCNYYYFAIGAACWSVASMQTKTDSVAAPVPVPSQKCG